MFGTKLEAANQRITALTALLAVAGLTIKADEPLPTVEAFSSTLENAQKASVDSATTALNAELATSKSTASAYTAGLAAAGVKVEAFKPEDLAAKKDAKEGELTPAATAVKTAVENAIAGASAKQIAATGHGSALDIQPGNSAPAASEQAPTTAAEFMEQLNAIKDPGANTAFYRKHAAKFVAKIT